MKSRNFLVALSKISQFSDTQQWCGCLTPSEAVELMNAGCVPTGNYAYYMKLRKSVGDCKPSWFYCTLSPEVKEALGKRMSKNNRKGDQCISH